MVLHSCCTDQALCNLAKGFIIMPISANNSYLITNP